MTAETLRDFFAWCLVVNYAMLMLWFILYIATHSWMKGLAQRFFNMSAEKFDSTNYKGMLFYKLGIFLFNLAPYLALRIMGV